MELKTLFESLKMDDMEACCTGVWVELNDWYCLILLESDLYISKHEPGSNTEFWVVFCPVISDRDFHQRFYDITAPGKKLFRCVFHFAYSCIYGL